MARHRQRDGLPVTVADQPEASIRTNRDARIPGAAGKTNQIGK
jgi:hypothetical protein